MIAVDTCILARYALKDDPAQTATATQFLKTRQCRILKSVILELAWVFSSPSGYNLPRQTVAERLRHICGLPTIDVEDASNVAFAITLFEKGMDFGDALHLASASTLNSFATFDKKMAAKAGKVAPLKKITLLK